MLIRSKHLQSGEEKEEQEDSILTVRRGLPSLAQSYLGAGGRWLNGIESLLGVGLCCWLYFNYQRKNSQMPIRLHLTLKKQQWCLQVANASGVNTLLTRDFKGLSWQDVSPTMFVLILSWQIQVVQGNLEVLQFLIFLKLLSVWKMAFWYGVTL